MQPRSTSLISLLAFSTLASSFAYAIVSPQQLDISGPAGSTAFGRTVTVLPNGNIVVTDPAFTPPAGNAPQGLGGVGAVYLYSPAGVLISTLTGTQTNDAVGSGGITVLKNGNFVIHSPDWDSGNVVDAGAATWANAIFGVSGAVGVGNSVIGSSAADSVGQYKAVALSNGNYVLPCPLWDLGLVQNAGAVIWANGSTGRVGLLSQSTALVGNQLNDRVGLRLNIGIDNTGGVIALSNGNYVVASSFWKNGVFSSAGAISWGNGSVGIVGLVSTANSLVGTHAGDGLGGSNGLAGNHLGAVFALSNGNYVITSPDWNNGFGAVSWANGNTGLTGNVSINNALIGKSGDFVGSGGITELSSGRYVISSPLWSSTTASNVGAVTWVGQGGTLANVVSAGNSLVGAKSDDQVGTRVVALSNGHFVVASPLWDGSVSDAGAVTWVSGNTGFAGTVAAGNSMVGTSAGDKVGEYVSPLSNGNYVITSPRWDKGALQNVGAVTLGLALGTTGFVSALNSLTGSSNDDKIGESFLGGTTPLSNGSFVVVSPNWDNGLLTNVGAATWVNGITGPIGVVSPANSLVGSNKDDAVGSQVAALNDGNYVVNSPFWSANSKGAVTWANGASGRVGPVTVDNSLVGSLDADRVGLSGISVINNGGYIVLSPLLDAAGGVIDTGAVTLVRSGGVSGLVNGTNSVRGTAASGGQNLVFDYDAVRAHLVVGRPDSNIVSIFNLPDTYFADGFETVL